MESILISIKKLLGIDAEYHDFDMDVIISINAALMAAEQIGVGIEGFSITSETETWTDFIGDQANIEAIKVYIYLKTRMIFDPPTSAQISEAYNNQIREYEYRLYITKDNEFYEEDDKK